MLKAILFDKDGTLIDFQKSWGPAMTRVIADFARGDAALAARLARDVVFDAMTQTFPATSPFVAGTSMDFAPSWAKALGHADPVALRARIDDALGRAARFSITPIADAPKVIATLRARGYKLGVATNDADGPTRDQALWLGIADDLDFIAGYDSGFGAKPAPGMVLAFAKAVGLAPGEIAMVGDSRHDLETARAAGAIAIGVLSGPAPREALAPLADHLLPDVSALPAFLDA
jgi:phosphoglycolate phosphatase